MRYRTFGESWRVVRWCWLGRGCRGGGEAAGRVRRQHGACNAASPCPSGAGPTRAKRSR